MECVRAQSLVAGHISEISLLYLYTVHGFRPNDVGKLLIMAADLTFVIGGGKCVDCAHYLGRMEAPALPLAVAAAGARVRTLRPLSGLRTADAADNSHQSADLLPMCSSPIGTRSTVPPTIPPTSVAGASGCSFRHNNTSPAQNSPTTPTRSLGNYFRLCIICTRIGPLDPLNSYSSILSAGYPFHRLRTDGICEATLAVEVISRR